jgi:hypothetical protein
LVLPHDRQETRTPRSSTFIGSSIDTSNNLPLSV